MKKSVIWLIIIVVILALIYFIIKGIEPKLERGEQTGFAAFDAAGVSKIEIMHQDGENDVTFVMDDDWELSYPIQYAADEQAMQRLFRVLTDMKFETIVSENPEKQSIFEVNGENGTNIKVYKNDVMVLDFYVGKTDQSGMNTYIREEGSDKVYAVQGNLSYTLDRPLDQWRDKAIINIPQNDLQQVEVTWNDTTVVFTLIDSLWSIVQGDDYMEVHQNDIGAITKAFSPLKAQQFQEEPVDVDWRNPEVLVEVRTLTGPEYACRFIPKDENQYYVKQDAADQIFLISKYAVDRFKRTGSDYQKK